MCPCGLVCGQAGLSSRKFRNRRAEASLHPSDRSNPRVQSGHVGAWAGLSWASAQPWSLRLGLEQQPLHGLVQHVEVLWGHKSSGVGTPEPPCPQAPCPAAHLDGRVRHAEVGPDAHGQQQVKDGWLDPGGQSVGSGSRTVTPQSKRGPSAPAHHSPVGIHHLLQLVIEDKLGVPARDSPTQCLPD